MKRSWTLVAAVLFSSPLFAQLVPTGRETDSVKTLDPVITTANKFEQKQSTTGKVITVITKEQIEKSAGKTVAQLLNEQAGVVVNGALNNIGSVQTLYVRGASSGRTLVLLDGIPVNDPSMINNEVDLNLFSLDNVEQVEICKGAQSTLYGSDAVAGVINIITVKKDVQTPVNVKATVSAGNYGMLKSNLQVYGKVDKLTYSARYGKIKANGFSSAYDSTGTGKFDNDKYDGDIANAQLLYQATKFLAFKTFALYSKYNAGVDAAVFKDDKDYTINNKSFMTGAGFIFKRSRFAINGNYQYSEMTRHYLNDSLDKTSTWYENNLYFGKSNFIELYGNAALCKFVTLVAGVDYRASSYNQHYLSVSSYGPYANDFPTTSVEQKSAYASVIFSTLQQRLNIEIGGRYNYHSIYHNNSTYTINPSLKLTDNFRIFGSLSTGFKAPSIYQLSNNGDLNAETSLNKEAGLAITTKKINARVVGFIRDIKNGIDYNYIDFNYFNYVRQKVKGIEIEADFKPLRILTISANYTYLSPEETTQNRKTNQDTVTYDYLLRRPAHNVNFTIGVNPLSSLYLSVSGKYVSSRYDVGGYMAPDVKLGDYFLLGAYGEYTYTKQLKFFMNLQNITNRKFFDVYGYNSIPFIFQGGIALNL